MMEAAPPLKQLSNNRQLLNCRRLRFEFQTSPIFKLITRFRGKPQYYPLDGSDSDYKMQSEESGSRRYENYNSVSSDVDAAPRREHVHSECRLTPN